MIFTVGCLIQWYEIKIVDSYFLSLIAALTQYKKAKEYFKGNEIVIDIKLYQGTDYEQPDNDTVIIDCENKIKDHILTIRRLGFQVNYNNDTNQMTTIAQYRRKFNDRYCTKSRLLVWGETDMLFPLNFFTICENLSDQIESQQIYKYLITFAICKMWDDSWKQLEHPKFTNHKHSDYPTDWWSLNYTMSQKEMDDINEPVDSVKEDVEIIQIKPIKFNGCGLVFSSDIIKAGANIPQAVDFIHEDSAFMEVMKRLLPDTIQMHIKNVLLVHNRKDLNKRSFIKGEKGNTIGQKRKSNDWYIKKEQKNRDVLSRLFDIHFKI